MMKKTYERPQMEVRELYMMDAILLPASYGATTDEALSRSFDDVGDASGSTDDEDW